MIEVDLGQSDWSLKDWNHFDSQMRAVVRMLKIERLLKISQSND